MRTLLTLILLSALLGTGYAQPSHAPFSITIKADNPVVKAGSEVYVRIRMTNVSTHDVDVSSEFIDESDRAYEYEVRDVGQKLLPVADRNMPIESNGWVGEAPAIKSGESRVTGGAYVSRLFDMSRPGEYTIQVSRRISSNPKDGVVKSNKITVTVVP